MYSKLTKSRRTKPFSTSHLQVALRTSEVIVFHRVQHHMELSESSMHQEVSETQKNTMEKGQPWCIITTTA